MLIHCTKIKSDVDAYEITLVGSSVSNLTNLLSVERPTIVFSTSDKAAVIARTGVPSPIVVTVWSTVLAVYMN